VARRAYFGKTKPQQVRRFPWIYGPAAASCRGG